MGPSDDDEVTKVITTIRDVPLNVQLIKAARRSAIELARLAELEPIPAPQASTMPSDNELFVAIYEVLCDWRRRAEHAGRVTTADNVPVLIEHFLASLLGRDCGYGLDGEAAVREVIRAFAFGRREPAECAGATGDAGQETGDRGQEAGDKGQWTGGDRTHSPLTHSPLHSPN